ncbi:MAG: phage head closure protein [Hyphomicrobiaceae bacterium]
MRSGKLDRTITIQAFTADVDDYGTPAPTWSDVATVRAELIQASTVEFIRAFGASDENIVIFRIRWLAGVTTSHRVVYDGQGFNIKELKEIGRRKVLELRTVSVGELVGSSP